jgi:hypothetical protein
MVQCCEQEEHCRERQDLEQRHFHRVSFQGADPCCPLPLSMAVSEQWGGVPEVLSGRIDAVRLDPELAGPAAPDVTGQAVSRP